MKALKIELVNVHGISVPVVNAAPKGRKAKPMIVVKQLAETIGLSMQAMNQRINRMPEVKSTVNVMFTVASDGKQREMTCLPLKQFEVLMNSTDTARMKDKEAAKK